MRKIPYSHIVIDEDGVGGGVVDHLSGVKVFTANSSPLEDPQSKQKAEKDKTYKRLRTMPTSNPNAHICWLKKINNHGIAIHAEIITEIEGVDNQSYKDDVAEELEQIKEKDPDKEKKLQVVPKEEVKSPDRAFP